MKKEAKHTPGPILNDGETPKGLMLLAGPEDREDECWSCGPTEGEEIMVNTPYDVFILPLRPSGLSSGPRFVVHVPGPEAQAAMEQGGGEAAPPSAPVVVPSAKTLASVVWSDWMTNEQADRLGDALHKWLTAYFAQQHAAEGVRPEARDVVDEGSRSVARQLLHWGGVPVHVTGTVTTSPGNWSLIDAALAANRQEVPRG